MSKKSMILGFTREGHAVLLPTRQTPDMGEFVTWTPGDHLDASRILVEHGERESEPIGSWCALWANAHWALGKKARRKKKKRVQHIRGGAETSILSRRRG